MTACQVQETSPRKSSLQTAIGELLAYLGSSLRTSTAQTRVSLEYSREDHVWQPYLVRGDHSRQQKLAIDSPVDFGGTISDLTDHIGAGWRVGSYGVVWLQIHTN